MNHTGYFLFFTVPESRVPHPSRRPRWVGFRMPHPRRAAPQSSFWRSQNLCISSLTVPSRCLFFVRTTKNSVILSKVWRAPAPNAVEGPAVVCFAPSSWRSQNLRIIPCSCSSEGAGAFRPLTTPQKKRGFSPGAGCPIHRSGCPILDAQPHSRHSGAARISVLAFALVVIPQRSGGICFSGAPRLASETWER